MRHTKREKKSKPKLAKTSQHPIMKVPAPNSAPESSGPPLTGEALELKVAEVLCAQFRKTGDRSSLQIACGGADHSDVEAAIVSPSVQRVIEPVMQAFTLEQTIAIICLLLCTAKAALQSEKPTPLQVTALKIVFETVVENILTRVEGDLWKESVGNLSFSDFEKSLIENLLQLVRGQRAPASGEREVAIIAGHSDEK